MAQPSLTGLQHLRRAVEHALQVAGDFARLGGQRFRAHLRQVCTAEADQSSPTWLD
jgi:hypothetical protein